MPEGLILIGTLPPPFDGQSVAFNILAESLDKRFDGRLEVINISGSRKRSNKYISNIFRSLDYSLVLAKLMTKLLFGYRILYLQIAQSKRGFLRDQVIVNIANMFNCKIVLHLHGGNYDGFYNTLDQGTQELVKKTLKKADKIIVLSTNLLGMFNFDPSLKEKLISIPNGIGQTKSSKEGKIILEGSEPINILYLSNLIETKGYLLVLESIKLLYNDYKLDVKAYFCGRFLVNSDISEFRTEKEAKDNFFSKVKQYNLQEVVKYEGVVTGDEKQKKLEKAHFMVLPTRYKNEGQPISIIEGMRAGCVVVTTNFRAMPEMIDSGVNGYLLNGNYPEEIAKIIASVSRDREKFKELSSNAINTYNQKFTENTHCTAIYEVLNKVIIN